MLKQKCPRCKSTDIVDQRWIYAMTPNICNKRNYERESSVAFRLLMLFVIFGMGLGFFIRELGSVDLI